MLPGSSSARCQQLSEGQGEDGSEPLALLRTLPPASCATLSARASSALTSPLSFSAHLLLHGRSSSAAGKRIPPIPAFSCHAGVRARAASAEQICSPVLTGKTGWVWRTRRDVQMR